MTKSDDPGYGVVRPSRPKLMMALAVSLAALAGWVDATGFIYYHGLFVSFMSGNSTQAAVSLIHRDFAQAAEFGRTILLFVIGVVVGELLVAGSGRRSRPIILFCESLCLGAAAVAARVQLEDALVASLLAFAMGLQNAVLHQAGELKVGLTYVTGTLVQVGRAIAGALRGAVPWRMALPFLGLWLGLTSGGLVGAFVALSSMFVALTAAAAICVSILIWALVQHATFAAQPQ